MFQSPHRSHRSSEREMSSGDSISTTADLDDQVPVMTISAVHPDILQTHIFTRLDGPTLSAVSCASSQLHSLSSDETLWREICNRTWPSTADPRLRHVISTSFPSGHRSFYSDSFPTLDHRIRNRHRPPPTNLISAVDIHYQDRLILSKVHETRIRESVSGFRVDVLDPKETVPMPVKLDCREDSCQLELEDNLTLSWILVDPTRTRAANISSIRPVSVDRNWVTGDIELRYVTVFSGGRIGELVQCGVVVACGGREDGELEVREVRLEVEDIEGNKLGWKESLVILEEAVVGGNRRKGKRGVGKEKYKECLKMKRERIERKHRREMRVEIACIASCVVSFIAFWMFVVVKLSQLLQLC